MNTGKVYFDIDGNERSIWQMVRSEPKWAAVRIQEGEKAIEELTAAKAENEALRGRVAELEEFAADAQKGAWRALDPDYVPPDVEKAMKALLHRSAVITGEIDPDDIEPTPWLLRKQAEAVDAALGMAHQERDIEYQLDAISNHAESLRLKADEIEND